MVDDLDKDKDLDPFYVLTHLDKSVEELEALLSHGGIDALQNSGQKGRVTSEQLESRTQALISKREEIEKALIEREKLFRALLKNISEAFLLLSPNGGSVSYISDACVQIWGYSAEDFYSDADLLISTFSDQDRERFLGAVASQLTAQSEFTELELISCNKEGEPREIRCRLFSVITQNGQKSPAAIVEDVTQSHLQDRELSQSISLLRATLDSTADGILVLDREGGLVDYNSQFVDIWSIPNAVIEQMAIEPLLEWVGQQLADPTQITLNADQPDRKLLQVKDDRYVECSLRPQKLNNVTYGSLWCCRDITEQTKAQEVIKYQATYDELTRLPNRRLLEERLLLSLSRCQRYGRIGALLFLDLDNFKTINDTLGHSVGDILLTEAASRLKGCLRQEDTAARLGGDEFVLLLTEFEADREQVSAQANTVAEKVLHNLSLPYEIEGHRLYVSASIGITLFPESPTTDIVEVLRQADTAMYRAKEAGRNTFRFYLPDMQEATQQRLQLQNDLHSAMVEDQFYLYWHPFYDIAGTIVGAEALIRWQHPQHGWILPDEFLKLAEATGIMRQLGEWVVDEATQFLRVLENELPEHGPIYIAVNVGLSQFQQIDFPERVLHYLEKNEANPSRLVVELKEDVLLGDIQVIQDKMYQLKRQGVRFAIDDFGTGLSSLAYLKKLPLDEVKIDRSFVNAVIKDSETVEIVEAMITMASKLGLGVVAEGVETYEEQKFLAKKGCKRFQGIFYSEPVTGKDFLELLLQGSDTTDKVRGQQSTFDGF